MKKRMISAFAAAIMFFSCLPQAFAKVLTVEVCEVNPDTQMVTLSGIVTDAEHLQKVTVRVISNEDNSLNYINQATIKTDGSFYLEYKMTGSSGIYTMHINTAGADEDFTKQIKFTDPNVIKEIINEINSKTTGESLAEYISDEAVEENLSISIEELNKIGPVSEACGFIVSGKYKFETATQFVEVLKSKTILAGINAANSMQAVMDFIDSYHTELKLDGLAAYEKYCEKKDDKVSELTKGTAQRIADMTFESEEDFAEQFKEQIVLEQVKQVGGYGEVYDILADNNDILNLSFTTYNSLKTKTSVMQALAGSGYKTAEDLKKAFDDACDEQYKKEHTPSSSGGGGSSKGNSSSGSGSSGFVNREPAKEEVKKDDENQQKPVEKYFSDLENYAWAEEGINHLYKKGVVSGDGTGRFNPSNNVTREEFIKMLTEMFGFEKDENKAVSFSDLKDGAWYTDYVSAAVAAGVVSGYPDGNFGIGQKITRQDMAVIIVRALEKAGKELPKKNDEKAFNDAEEISDYAKDSVVYMQTCGIINGFDDGSFAPAKSATRAEAARILYLIDIEIN